MVNILPTIIKIKKKKIKSPMLRSDFCDYSDRYVFVKGRRSVAGTDNANEA